MLLTLVEPHRGHEVAYNRWYERDHFYSGCMVGPYNFAGVASSPRRILKALRDPDSSAITGEPARGSYISAYWVLDGYFDVWNRGPCVRSTCCMPRAVCSKSATMCTRCWTTTSGSIRASPTAFRSSSPWTTPIGASSPFSSTGPTTSPTRSSGRGCAPSTCPAYAGQRRRSGGRLHAGRLEVDAPGDVPRERARDNRTVLLWFLNTPPEVAWEPVIAEHRRRIEEAGKGTVIAVLPFIPTIPGTDTTPTSSGLD